MDAMIPELTRPEVRDANARTWLILSIVGLGLTAAFGAGEALLQMTWAQRAACDASLLGFAVPACVSTGLWCNTLLRRTTPRYRATSEATLLLVTLYTVAALFVGLAQGLVAHPWLVGHWPLHVTLSLGAAALSPRFVGIVKPQWLHTKKDS